MSYRNAHNYNFGNFTDFPEIKKGVVCSAEFETCKENKLILSVAKVLDDTLESGIPKKAWWIIETQNLPDRFVLMYDGKRSLKRLLQNYGFSDVSGCVHYNKGKIFTANTINDLPHCNIDVPKPIMDTIGIPQRLENSGICWYAATCFAFFHCEQLRKMICDKIKDRDLVNYCKLCLKDPKISEKLRHKLWHDYAFGDDVNQAPELDGQNGLTQFCILASKLDIPIKRFFVTSSTIKALEDPVKDQKGKLCPVRSQLKHKNEKHLLVIRFYRGDSHTKFKPMRRFIHDGIRYKLASMLLGSMHCGHQIGASCYDLSWKRWAVSDSDASMFGIGPVHFQKC